jgi:hypothetical protein
LHSDEFTLLAWLPVLSGFAGPDFSPVAKNCPIASQPGIPPDLMKNFGFMPLTNHDNKAGGAARPLTAERMRW